MAVFPISGFLGQSFIKENYQYFRTSDDIDMISGQPFIKGNCHYSRTSDDIDMKLEQVSEPDKKNKIRLKEFNDNVMPADCDVIVIFLICGQFGAIQEPDSRRKVGKIYIFINSNSLPYKN